VGIYCAGWFECAACAISQTVIASEAKQFHLSRQEGMDCFVARAPRNDDNDKRARASRPDAPSFAKPFAH
jgi:hypothetical protein